MEPKSKLSSDTVDWCKEQGSKAETLDDVLAGPDTVVMEAIQAGIDRYNKGLLHNIGRNVGISRIWLLRKKKAKDKSEPVFCRQTPWCVRIT